MATSATERSYQLLPPLRQAEFELLKQDIAQRGVLVPIELDEQGNVLDGHHRLRAVRELREEGTEVPDPSVIARIGLCESAKRAHVRALNLHRRHLSASERRAVIEAQLQDTPDVSDRLIASQLSVSHTTVGMIRRRLGGSSATGQNGQLERRVGRDGKRRKVPAQRTVMAGSQSEANRALEALKTVPIEALPERTITAADASIAARIVRREDSRASRMEQLRDPGDLKQLCRGKKYAVLYADPPWRYSGASDPTRVAENHYPTMSHEELLELPVSEIAARDAVLFLWATPPKLAEAVELIDAWGFRLVTSAVWDKQVPGLGSWFRQQHELLLIATRGKVPAPAPADRPSSVIRAPRGKHSAKPAIVREYIERMFPDARRVELFARGAAKGWHSWGFEAQSNRPGRKAG